MKKALNFDLDTRKYEKFTKRPAPTAYGKIRSFLKRNGFEHRQGSGYISNKKRKGKNVHSNTLTFLYYWLYLKQIKLLYFAFLHKIVYEAC